MHEQLDFSSEIDYLTRMLRYAQKFCCFVKQQKRMREPTNSSWYL